MTGPSARARTKATTKATTKARLATLGLMAALALAGCSDDDFDPITRITAPRVLALISEPTVLPVDGDVRLDAVTVDALGPRGGSGPLAPPAGRPVDAIRMRACTPWKLFADPALDCTGADALALSPDDTGRFVMPTADLVAAFPPPMTGGIPATIETLRLALAAGLDLRVPVIAEVDVDGETLIARRDIRVAAAVGQLENPRFTELRFDGAATRTLRAGQRYTLTVAFDRQSLDPSNDDDDHPASLEEIDCNLYSPGGELADREVDVEEPDVPHPETEPNAYTAGPPGPTWIYLVATDETGGMSFAAVPLTIE